MSGLYCTDGFSIQIVVKRLFLDKASHSNMQEGFPFTVSFVHDYKMLYREKDLTRKIGKCVQ